MSAPVLTRRQLNRATLARQMLLERADRPIAETIAFLLGPQAQISEGPYQALWSRLRGFRHQELTRLIEDKTLLRATSMRGTLHLHTVPDMVGIRKLVQPVLDRMWQSNFAKRFGDGNRPAVIRAGRRLLDKGPMTANALRKGLVKRFPEPDPLSMTVLLQVSDILVQIPPTRIWGSGHAPILTRIGNWIEPPKPAITRRELVLRYLAAFGPASVADMQTWCGLTKLDADFAAVRNQLITFADETGRTLYDLPDAPRPPADTAAPVRFLPVYDNVILGYADRSRIIDAADVGRLLQGETNRGSVLIDGMVGASWGFSRTKAGATLDIRVGSPLVGRDKAALEAEAEAFVGFMTDGKGGEIKYAPQ
ncbi:winged helix DNA-binding domain-containing protein [Devosia nitrariae]|uniref:Winged helix DNA-binding domain-containing protein n=1 Tax=Devosia nitrariae TaxID=2071872 RepID=A0ABQ5W2V5_9HYPH|nr:winged helix DNA-binding domain-containing protein [Devosia nitrariae]GLQ54199.1 hypothetical protein GCM10010862_14580 [Devosia nitrariae]